MHTYALQALFQFQSDRKDDDRFDGLLEEVRAVAERHGVTFADFQSFSLAPDVVRVRPCDRCGHLTYNGADVVDGNENMVADFWFHNRRGIVSDSAALCDHCRIGMLP